MTYKNKYLKYKLKYLNLKKKLYGGMEEGEPEDIEMAPSTPPLSPSPPHLQEIPDTIEVKEKLIKRVSTLIDKWFPDLTEIFNHSKESIEKKELYEIIENIFDDSLTNDTKVNKIINTCETGLANVSTTDSESDDDFNN